MNPPKNLIARVRTELEGQPGLSEKRMFGSTAFLIQGKLCIGARAERLMCRIDPATQPELLRREGCTRVVMKGRKMSGYVYVAAEALLDRAALVYWIQRSLTQVRSIAQ